MASLRNLKNLPEWLELDYFRRPRPLKAMWKPVILTTLLLASFLLLAMALVPRRLAPHVPTAYQAGPVAPVHAMFNNDCGKCHVEAFRTWDRLWRFNSAIRSVRDETCLQCHAGTVHSPAVAEQDSCVSCHREHHGAAALAQIPDAGCTHCHANLTAALRAGETTDVRNVSGFASHPPFAQRWKGAPKDPAALHFNHAVHLNPAGVTIPHDSAAGNDRRTQRQVLECAHCHTANEAGTVMRPIQYDRHCAGCHPLTVAVPITVKGDAAALALERFRRTPAPHQPPEIVRGALRDRLTSLIQAAPELLGGEAIAAPPRPVPGTKVNRPEPVGKEAFEWVNQQLVAVEKPLFWAKGQAGCAYCHERNGDGAEHPQALPDFWKTDINERPFPGLGMRREWFPQSRFNHGSHRMLDCTQCHPARDSRLTADVLLPGIDNCRRCHNGLPGAGAPTDCVGCHSYHPGRGEQRFHGRLTIDQALGK